MRQASILSVLLAAALLSGCGGGGGSSVPTAPANAPSTSAPTSKAIATANLTVRFPSSFHHAKVGTSTTRSAPKYVNPGSYYLDVFVDGNHVIAPGSPNVVNSPDGTQTFTLPIYSTSGHQVVAVESDSPLNSGNILSLGEYDIAGGSFSAGDSFAVGLTMQMNVTQVGFMTDTNGTAASTGSPYNIGCPGPTPFTVGPLYAFAADATGGFVTNAGLGSVTPTITNWKSNSKSPANTLTTTTTGQNQGYNITFNNVDDQGVQVQLSTLNPAYTIQQDVYNQFGDYPGIQNLYNSSQLYIYTINSVTNFVVNVTASC